MAWRSERYTGRKVPLKKPGEKEKMQCPVCKNEATVYYGDNGKPVFSAHRDYGLDAKGKPKKKGPYSTCKGK